MDFDIRTPDTAYFFLLDFLKMNGEEFIDEHHINCEADYELFWDRNFDRIDQVDISGLRFIGFHITSNWDNCAEIRAKGLMDLKRVLSEETSLNHLLRSHGIVFDIVRKLVYENGKEIDIDYNKFIHRNRFSLSEYEEKIMKVAHRVYYDYLVNGFYTNDNVFGYGTQIHERPEFFIELTNLFPQLQKAEHYWKTNSRSYKITFFAYLNQLAPFSFDLNNLNDPPFDDWYDLTMEQRLKKQMLRFAIERAFENLSEQYMYIKNGIGIPPDQIISYEEITE